MANESTLTGEVSNSKAAAVFDTVQAAEAAAKRVSTELRLSDAQVQVLRPGESSPGRKLEPESHGIFRTMVVAHVRLGVLGLLAGSLLFALMYWLSVPWVMNSPIAAAAVFIAFGAVAGLLLGGLVTLRPDHDRYLLAVQEALKDGKSAVVVHAFSPEQQQGAEELLKTHGGATIVTL